MYENLVRHLREDMDTAMRNGDDDFWRGWIAEAADAIEELSRDLDGMNEANIALYGALPKWIPVTERCPEKSGDYLVFDDCRNIYVNEWHCLLKMWQYDDSRITHWMPLPEPPKEET